MEERKSRYELFLEEEARKAQPTKQCTKCKEVKALTEYHKDKNRPLGVMSRCKVCENTPRRKYKNREDRFWKFYHSHTVRVGDCVEWTGFYSPDGYPMAKWKRTNTRVRRLVYMLAFGELSDDIFIATSCQNKRCVRHSHLMPVTQEYVCTIAANQNRPMGERNGAYTKPDRRVRGKTHGRYLSPERTARGEKHGMSVLTESSVRAMRDLYAQGGLRYSDVGAAFGVSANCAWMIVNRKSWAHVQ